MSAHLFAAAKQSIEDNGFCVEIQVRDVGPGNPKGSGRYEEDGLEIVDGFHRWKAAQDLGMKKVPIRNIGVVTDLEAEQRTAQMNLKGDAPNDLLLAKSVARLQTLYDDSDELALHTGLTGLEVEALLSLEDPDWPEIQSGESASGGEKSFNVSVGVSEDDRDRWRVLLKRRPELETNENIKSNAKAVFILALQLLEKELQ